MQDAARDIGRGRITTLAVAIAGGLVAAFAATRTRDPLDAFALLSSASLFLFALFAQPKHALTVVLASTTVGILGRIHLATVAGKPFALRPEEAAVAGLWLGGAVKWVALEAGSHAARVRRALLWFTAAAALSYALSFLRWSPRQVATGGLYLARWIAFGGVLLAALPLARTAEGRRTLVDGIVGAGVALCVLGFVQLAFWPDMEDLLRLVPAIGDALVDPHVNRLVSTVLDPNLLGAMLAVGTALVTARALSTDPARSRNALFLLAVFGAAVVLSVSRGALLASAVGCMVVVLLVRPALLWGLALLVPVLALAGPRVVGRFKDGIWVAHGTPVHVLGLELRPEPSAYMRVRSWLEAADLVRAHPFFGVGYNNFGLAVSYRPGAFGTKLYGTDSTLLLVLATCGIVGLAFFVLLLWRCGRAAHAALRSDGPLSREIGAGALGALGALLVAATFTNALVYPPVLVLLWVLVAAACGAADERR